MAEEVGNETRIAPTDPAPSVAAPAIDAGEYARLRDLNAEYEATLRRLEPHADRINRIVNDSDYASFADEGYDAYRAMREKREKPEIDPLLQPVLDRFAPVVDYVETLRQRESQAAKDEEANFVRENADFANRLAAENPNLRENNNRRLYEVAAFADSLARVNNRRVGIEEAWKVMQGYAPAKETPAPSLRADSGATGIPDKSARDNSRYQSDFYGATLDSLKRARNAG